MLQNTVTVAISFIVSVFKQLSVIMDKHNFLPYFQTLQETGWTLRECIHGKGSETPAQVQPDWFKGSYQEYSDTMKSYILNIKIHAGIVQQPDTCLVPFSQRLNNL